MLQLLPTVHKESWLVVVTTLALVAYGVLQERVMTKGWGPQQELFTYSSFLVLSNRLLTVLVLIAHSLFAGHSFMPMAPLRSYCLVSASNMVSTLCQYEALKYVSFVAQTLAKTAKALPVVLWGTIVGGKRYSARQYIHAILITGGCSMFVLGGDITSGSATRDPSWRSYAAGSVLLLTFLAADGWTSTQQEVLFKTHATPVREQLLYTTAFSTMYSLAVTVAGGTLLPALSFLQRHPDAFAAVVSLSLASTVIQVCISSVLQRHGALMFALMMTSRQCVSVLLSTILFGHSLGISQWCGIAVAFSALYHQKTTTGKDGGNSNVGSSKHSHHPSTRSRLAVSSGPAKARESGASGQPLLLIDAVSTTQAHPGMLPAVSQKTVAYRGSHTGSHHHSNSNNAGGVAAVASGLTNGAGATAFDVAMAAGGGGGGSSAGGGSAVGTPTSPALMGPWRSASLYTGHDPHLVAVADVQPVPVGGGAAAHLNGSSGHVLHRHSTHHDGLIHHTQQQQQQQYHHHHHHHYQQQQHLHHHPHHHPAGMALNFPGMKSALPVPIAGFPPAAAGAAAPAGSGAVNGNGSAGHYQYQQQTAPKPAAAAAVAPAVVAAAAPHSSLMLGVDAPPALLAAKKQQSFDLRTLWSRGTGRVTIDPTTAVAMDHRDK